jgi:site-specific DNA-methyltransferase (adenine-specific)
MGVNRNSTLADFASQGRYPSHLILDDSDEVTECFPMTNGGTAFVIGGTDRKKEGFVCTGSPDRSKSIMNFGDTGSASRYFKRIAYFPKCSVKDRNEGCEELPLKTGADMSGRKENSDGLIRIRDDGTLGENPYAGKTGKSNNHHPTVKSTELMRYLCKLITPPNGIILDPFGGSGSTGKAAVMEGFRYILIEQSPEYVEIAKRRILSATEQISLI